MVPIRCKNEDCKAFVRYVKLENGDPPPPQEECARCAEKRRDEIDYERRRRW